MAVGAGMEHLLSLKKIKHMWILFQKSAGNILFMVPERKEHTQFQIHIEGFSPFCPTHFIFQKIKTWAA